MYRCIVHVPRGVVFAVGKQVSSPAQQLLYPDQRDQETIRVVFAGLLDFVAALDQVGAVCHWVVSPEEPGESANKNSQPNKHQGMVVSWVFLQRRNVESAEGGPHVVQRMFSVPKLLDGRLRHSVLQHEGRGLVEIQWPSAKAEIDHECNSQLHKICCLGVDEEVEVAPENTISFDETLTWTSALLLTTPYGLATPAVSPAAAHC